MWKQLHCRKVFPDGSECEESTYSAGDPDSIPGLGRSLETEGNGDPLRYSCLENPMDRGAWWGRTELDTTDPLRTPLQEE